MRSAVDQISYYAAYFSLRVSVIKAKASLIFSDLADQQLFVDSQKIRSVTSLKYAGSALPADDHREDKIAIYFDSVLRTCSQVPISVLICRNINFLTKILHFWAAVHPVTNYGCKT